MALYLVFATPYLMDVTGDRERDHAFSLQSALWPLAAFVGSLLGGALPVLWSRLLGLTLDDPAPYRLTLYVAVLLLAPSVLPLWRARETMPGVRPEADAARSHGYTGRRVGGEASAIPWALFAPIILVGVLRIAGESAVRTFLNVYLDLTHGLPSAQIGAWMAIGSLIAAPAALASPLVSGRWGRHRTVAWGAVCTGLFLLPLALIPHPLAAGASWIGLTTMVAIVRPAFMVYTQTSVGARWQPLMSGATNLAAGLGSAFILLSGGFAVAALGFQRFFLIPAGLFCIAGVVFGVLLPEREGGGWDSGLGN
jgi:MFS family permease